MDNLKGCPLKLMSTSVTVTAIATTTFISIILPFINLLDLLIPAPGTYDLFLRRINYFEKCSTTFFAYIIHYGHFSHLLEFTKIPTINNIIAHLYIVLIIIYNGINL